MKNYFEQRSYLDGVGVAFGGQLYNKEGNMGLLLCDNEQAILLERDKERTLEAQLIALGFTKEQLDELYNAWVQSKRQPSQVPEVTHHR